MKDANEVDLDPKLPEGVQETAESQRDYKFNEVVNTKLGKDSNKNTQIQNNDSDWGHLRMFDKVGSKTVMLIVKHHDSGPRKGKSFMYLWV